MIYNLDIRSLMIGVGIVSLLFTLVIIIKKLRKKKAHLAIILNQLWDASEKMREANKILNELYITFKKLENGNK